MSWLSGLGGFFWCAGGFGGLPGLFLQGKPLDRHGEVALGIRPIAGFELFAEACPALGFDVVPNCSVDESAPGALGSDAVEDGHGLVWQDDVDAFAHGFNVLISSSD